MLAIWRRPHPPFHAQCRPGELSLVLHVTCTTSRKVRMMMMILLRDKSECSPKFIVTLDGVPSPLANLTEHDMDTDPAPSTMTSNPSAEHRMKSVHLRMTSDLSSGGKDTQNLARSCDALNLFNTCFFSSLFPLSQMKG